MARSARSPAPRSDPGDPAHQMNGVYRIKEHLRAVPAGHGLVFLLGELERFALSGRLYELVVPLIDGRRTAAEIAQALSGHASAAEVLYTLDTLRQRGYAVDAALPADRAEAAFWESRGIDAARAERILGGVAVAVDAVGDADPGALRDALAEAGLGSREPATLRVTLTRDYLDPGLGPIADAASAAGVPWVPVKLAGPVAWIGPLFRRRDGAGRDVGRDGDGDGNGMKGACFHCLRHRLRANRPDRVFVQRRSGADAPQALPVAETRASLAAGARLAAMEIARLCLAGPAASQRLLTLDHARVLTTEHPVVARPQCPRCGDGELLRRRGAEPVRLEPRPKRPENDGGFRTVSADETLERMQVQISPITGVVVHASPVPARNHPMRPVFASAFFACPSHDDPSFDEFGRTTLGKGRTASQARAGAIAEAVERYSAVWQGDEALVHARLDDLGGEALHPDDLQNFSDRQFAERDALNRRVKELRRSVPRRFDPAQSIHWAPAWSLTGERRRYLPITYSYLYSPFTPESESCAFNPNGHAAGNCREEAVLQAFLELAERDAIAVWWYNRIPRSGVDLDSFEDPYVHALRKHYAALGQRMWVLDITNDLRIPAFAALARAEEGGRYSIGFGCHLDAAIGLQRALTELNQLFDPTGKGPSPWDDAAVTNRTYLFPDEGADRRRAADYPAVVTKDLKDDVATCVERARAVGLETVVLDQTRPDTGLHAVKVVVPGLRHIWPRLAPGRLYDVPVKLGWLARPLGEDELNQVHLFL